MSALLQTVDKVIKRQEELKAHFMNDMEAAKRAYQFAQSQVKECNARISELQEARKSLQRMMSK